MKLDLAQLKQMISQGESHCLEFKTSTGELDEACQTLCGFLNNKGGIVLLGVGDKGNLVGQQVADKTRQKIGHAVNSFEPPANIEVEYVLLHDDKYIVVLTAEPLSEFQPYEYKKVSYQRLESITSPMPYERKKQLLQTNMQAVRYEDLTAHQQDLSLLDEGTIRETVRIGINAKRIPIEALDEKTEDILQHHFGVLRAEGLTNAAFILFGKSLMAYYPQCYLKMAKFDGTDVLSRMIDSRQITGNAFYLYHEAQNFIDRNLSVASEFPINSFERIDTPQLPILAIREAIINALCHRDYTNSTGSMSLAIYSDRLEIWNTGRLVTDLSIESLKVRHTSIRRNPKIAYAFYSCGYIDQWGMGTVRMINLCRQQGLPEPSFAEESGGLTVCLYFAQTVENPQLYTAPLDLSVQERNIIELIRLHQPTKSAVLLEQAGYPSMRMLGYALTALKKKGLITSQGRGQWAVWSLTERSVEGNRKKSTEVERNQTKPLDSTKNSTEEGKEQ